MWTVLLGRNMRPSNQGKRPSNSYAPPRLSVLSPYWALIASRFPDGSVASKHSYAAGWGFHIRSPEGETVRDDWGSALLDPTYLLISTAQPATPSIPSNVQPSSLHPLGSSLRPYPPRRLAITSSMDRNTFRSIYFTPNGRLLPTRL